MERKHLFNFASIMSGKNNEVLVSISFEVKLFLYGKSCQKHFLARFLNVELFSDGGGGEGMCM